MAGREGVAADDVEVTRCDHRELRVTGGGVPSCLSPRQAPGQNGPGSAGNVGPHRYGPGMGNARRRQARSLAAEAAFKTRLAELGATLREPVWLGIHQPHRAVCSEGHECMTRPGNVLKGAGICRPCAINKRPRSADSLAAEAAFRARLAELGATLLEPEWLGNDKPHRTRCAQGHECAPYPTGVQQGRGICRTCAGKDPAAAYAAFRERLAELGATLLEPVWLGALQPHRVRCHAGHACEPQPNNVQQGWGICATCAGNDPATAFAAFKARLAELGATLLQTEWLGANKPHRVHCRVGHERSPRPSDVLQGGGVCGPCAGNDPATAFAAFKARLAELGATLLEPKWLGKDTPHRAICSEGHECAPFPCNVRDGRGPCRTCSGNDSAAAFTAFRSRLMELGATLLEPEWLGKDKPHRVRCKEGHECTPRPGSVRSGQGICATCAGRVHDVFYIVHDPAAHRVKFGITSGDPRPRLRTHHVAGYQEIVRLMPGLPGDVAGEMERAVRAALTLADLRPVQGREHYDLTALAVILDMVDNYPIWLAATHLQSGCH